MRPMEELKNLLDRETKNLPRWFKGYIPEHYKRLSIPKQEAIELAKAGQIRMGKYYGDACILYFTQSLIAGAIFSDKYDEIVIVTPSQYGKSWLMGHIALVKAYEGEKQLVTHVTQEGTNIIMGYVIKSIRDIDQEVQKLILGGDLNKLDRLDSAVSKEKISIPGKGSIEAISLSDTLNDKKKSKAIGRGANTINDEAALQSTKAHAELVGRSQLQKDKRTLKDKYEKNKNVYISNPHNPGWFYDKLVAQEVPKNTLVIWMDALTALEEGKWEKEDILDNEFNIDEGDIKTYWLCELESLGEGMFESPIIDDDFEEDDYAMHFFGIDSAYKGKDDICIAHIIENPDGKMHVAEIFPIPKPPKSEWIDVEISKDILDKIKVLAYNKNISYACSDLGGPGGGWVNEGLLERHVPVKGIYFNNSPTKGRVQANQWEAKNAYDMRAEMHLDLKNLMDSKWITYSSQAAKQIKDILPLVVAERKQKKIMIRPKKEIKVRLGHSPDALDSLLLGVHAAMIYNQL